MDAPRKSDLIDRPVDLLRTTDRAALVRDHDTDKTVWLPLSQCEIAASDDGRNHIATLPEWLAIEKELL